jgi:hypothetical protein|tara:strand:- start:541 stop:867 length:327 start_codon:yes stop_codon:yes gene_type:complete
MKNTNISDSYIMTAHTKSAGDMLELETVRSTVKAINKMAAQKDKSADYRFQSGWTDVKPVKSTRYRVKCQGRGPRTAAAIADGKHPRKYDQSLPLRHAERMDVYVYTI